MTLIDTLLPDVKAVLFDLDGTMINSEPLHAKALTSFIGNFSQDDFIDRFSGQCDDDVYKGLNLDFSFEEFLNRKNTELLKIIENLEDKDAHLTPGIFEFLNYLKDKGMLIGVVSASHNTIANALLNKFDLSHFFKVKVFREDTFLTKPSPSPYFKAQRDLQCLPNEVLIFEDSDTGLTAAGASGAKVIQISAFTPKNQNFENLNSYLDLFNPH